ncbi:cytosolic sulfotransferase 6-like [Andrographis paniculata]|uniref:cytosolic sulfotransferase 6-like n=1 Tax=Andrographis paniculata TaxID=175694 RepID=UPI0021E89F1B|nr:cytosolic sulfotransferase 6-like [Andrographis paniculata]
MSFDEPSAWLLEFMQDEDKLSQEMKTFISNLPKKKGLFAPNNYEHEGFWYPAVFLQGVLACQRHFHSQSSDIFLVTYPKSGTTWLKALLFALLNRRRFPIDKNHPLCTTNSHDLVPFLEMETYLKTPNPNLDHLSSPRLFSTHMPWTALPESIRDNSTCKIVYLCRNPKDTVVSSYHFWSSLKLEDTKKELDPNSLVETLKAFCQGVNEYGPFWRHMLDYWKQSKENPDRIYFLKYEDMKEQPTMHLRRLAEFLDCPFSPDEEESGLVEDIIKLCSFENLSNLEVNKNGKLSYSGIQNSSFFRQGKTGDWKNHLTDEMVRKLNAICEEKLREIGF